jgi:hypothetical protein
MFIIAKAKGKRKPRRGRGDGVEIFLRTIPEIEKIMKKGLAFFKPLC